jgi:hypothetical protein
LEPGQACVSGKSQLGDPKCPRAHFVMDAVRARGCMSEGEWELVACGENSMCTNALNDSARVCE